MRTSAPARGRLALVALLGSATAPAAPEDPVAAGAAPPTEGTRRQREDAAKEAYVQAARKLATGDNEAALALFREADRLVPGPAPKFRVAQTLEKLGRVGEAATAYAAFLEDRPDPDRFFAKVEEAQGRMRALRATPATIRVTTNPPSPPNLVLAVDRIPQLGGDLVVMPGTHTITAVADGWQGSQTVEVAPAEVKGLLIALAADLRAPVAAPAVLTVAPAAVVIQSPAPPPSRRVRTAAYVLFGLAGVETIVGAVFGVLALRAQRDYDATSSRAAQDEMDRLGLLADVSFATGLTFGVGGALLLLLDDTPVRTAPGK